MNKQIDVVLGLQRGDEGKGRIVDKLAEDHDVVARYNGGPNAGHTIHVKGQTIALHQVPAGALYPDVINIIGNGMYVDPIKLIDEMDTLAGQGIKLEPKNLAISYGAHLILPHHILLDELREGGTSAQGSTKAGIAYVAADKYERSGVRAELLDVDSKLLEKLVAEKILKVDAKADAKSIAKDWIAKAAKLKPFITDTAELLDSQLKAGKKVLAEGAQASWLDIDGGMYPFVTSSHPTIGGALNGLRFGHQYVHRVIGVLKAIPSHVGDGPFVTEINDEKLAAEVRGKKEDIDGEFGATTGRARRVGWLDLPAARTAIRDNGVSEIALTKLDSIQKLSKLQVAVGYKYKGKELKTAPASAYMLEQVEPVYKQIEMWQGDISDAKSFDELPAGAQDFIKFLETELGVPVTMIGTGPGRDQLISR